MSKKAKKVFIVSVILSVLILITFIFSSIFLFEGISLVIQIKNAGENDNTLSQGIGLALVLVALLISSIIGMALSLINFLINIIFMNKNKDENLKPNRIFLFGSIISVALLIIMNVVYIMMV